MKVETLTTVDTDRFGTFTGEVARKDSQLDAARAKIEAAFVAAPDARVALASEGSFGPHPYVPFAPLGCEIVVLSDRETGLELVGHDATLGPRFTHAVVDRPREALTFARRVGFPTQGVVVMASGSERGDPERFLCKSAKTEATLAAAVREAVALCGSAHLETDMRAHRNPTRMRAIRRASADLVRTALSLCPACGRPGFVVRERLHGVPCGWCGSPTEEVRAEVHTCVGCGHRFETAVGAETVDPGRCGFYNP